MKEWRDVTLAILMFILTIGLASLMFAGAYHIVHLNDRVDMSHCDLVTNKDEDHFWYECPESMGQ